MSEKCTVTLADLSGPVKIKQIELDFDFDPYIWTDGNYSCDCNRFRFFYDSCDEFPCGQGRFLLLKAETETHIYSPDPYENALAEVKK